MIKQRIMRVYKLLLFFDLGQWLAFLRVVSVILQMDDCICAT